MFAAAESQQSRLSMLHDWLQTGNTWRARLARFAYGCSRVALGMQDLLVLHMAAEAQQLCLTQASQTVQITEGANN